MIHIALKQGENMKSVAYRRYGSADVLKRMEINTPGLLARQVLVGVRAVPLNPHDWT
jgi:NADPH:quinone reductase-like Zn-dependent oxidoreductase